MVAPSFADFLTRYAGDLEAGRYGVERFPGGERLLDRSPERVGSG